MASTAPRQTPSFGSRLPASLPYVAAGSILLAHALLAWTLRTPAFLTSQDDTQYYLLAHSLRNLRYVDVWLVGAPVHGQYPPGYPLLLAFWEFVAAGRYDVYLALNIFCTAATLGILFVVITRIWNPAIGLMTMFAVAFNPYVLIMPGELRPEASFGLVTTLALGLTLLSDNRRIVVLAAGAGAVLSFLLRLPGLAVPAAIGLHWACRRRLLRTTILLITVGATAGAWILWIFNHPEQYIGSSYAADLTATEQSSMAVEFVNRVSRNAVDYGSQTIPNKVMLPSVPGTPVDNVVTTGIVVLGLIAGSMVLLRRWTALFLFLLLYGGILAVWTWQSGRYLYPVLPLLVATVLLGVAWLASRVHRRAAVPVVAVLALVMAANGLWNTAALVRRAGQCERGGAMPHDSCLGPEQQGYFAALRFIGDSTAGGAVVHASKPEPIFLYTGRLTVGRAAMLSALEADSEASLEPLREAGVTHVLLAHLAASDRRIFRQMERRCDLVGLRASFGPETYLFSVPPPGDAPPRGACAALERYGRATVDPATGRVREFPASWPPPERDAQRQARD